MKKIVSLILAVLLMGTMFVGCGCSKTEKSASSDASASVVINSADDLKNKKIAVQEGTTGDILATGIEGTTITRFKGGAEAALELKNGRVDCVIIDSLRAQKIVELNDDMKVLDVAPSDEIEQYAIAVQKGDTALCTAINGVIEKLKEDGTYAKLSDYFLTDVEGATLPEIPEYKAEGKIIMGTHTGFEPFEYIDDNGNFAGFDVELAKWIAYNMECELVIEDMNFDALIAALQSGKVDFVAAGMTATDERRQNVDFSDNYYEARQAIIVMK